MFWENERVHFPNMARVAYKCSCLSPAPSAVFERGFSLAERLITGSQSSLGAACAEMVVSLNGNIDVSTTEGLGLSTDQAVDAVPELLINPEQRVVELSVGDEK